MASDDEEFNLEDEEEDEGELGRLWLGDSGVACKAGTRPGGVAPWDDVAPWELVLGNWAQGAGHCATAQAVNTHARPGSFAVPSSSVWPS